jgi:hypothetical protein
MKTGTSWLRRNPRGLALLALGTLWCSCGPATLDEPQSRELAGLESAVTVDHRSASTWLYFADVTGEGCADKIYWNPTFDLGRARVYVSNCDGTFTFLTAHTGGTSVVPETRLYFADVNGDGRADKLFWRPDGTTA